MALEALNNVFVMCPRRRKNRLIKSDQKNIAPLLHEECLNFVDPMFDDVKHFQKAA